MTFMTRRISAHSVELLQKSKTDHVDIDYTATEAEILRKTTIRVPSPTCTKCTSHVQVCGENQILASKPPNTAAQRHPRNKSPIPRKHTIHTTPTQMSRKVLQTDQIVKLIVGAGQASPSPPVGPALGSKGVKSMDFCKVRRESLPSHKKKGHLY